MADGSRLRNLLTGKARITFPLAGLGGEGILRTLGREQEALSMLEEAYRSGIRYFDSAPAYAGSERYLGSFWNRHPDWKRESYQASKSAERNYEGAKGDLARTLDRLKRDYLDLWQIHDVRTREDLRRIERKEGALRAFTEARETGLVRGIGVTGHHDPEIIRYAVEHWPVDAVFLPVNPVEAAIGGFLDSVLPAAQDRGIGVIGMKTLGAGNFIFPDAGISPELLLRFALSQPVDLIVVGCGNPDEARALAGSGKKFLPVEPEEQERLVELFRPYARRLAWYRGTV